MKQGNAMILAVVLIAVFLMAGLGVFAPTIPAFLNPQAPTTTTTTTVNPSDMASVNKQLKIVVVDELAGGNPDGTTNAISIYSSDGKTKLETGSLSSGSVTSANTYPSGTTLWIEYYYDTTIDAYKWWQVTVPQMTKADAESLTTNQITLKTREAGAYTDSLLTASGLTLTDGFVLNTTGSSNDTGTMTYNFFTTTDNTGYPSFHDPIYNIDVKPVVWATLSGGSYSSVTLTGFDGGFEKGSTMYYYKVVSDNDVSKYKVGNDYIYPGAGSITFGWNAVGYSNSTAAAYTTLQLYLEIYSSPSYMEQYGSYGPYAAAGAEQTVLLEDTS